MSRLPIRQTSTRCFGTAEVIEIVEHSKKPVAKKPKRISLFNSIYDYLKTSDAFMAHYSKMNSRSFRRTPQPSTSYCMTEESADAIFQCLKSHVNLDTPFVEINPGPGLLTRRLLDFGAKKIIIFEKDHHFVDVVSSLASNDDRVTLFPHHFFRIWNADFKDSFDGGSRLKSYFKGVEVKDWKDDPALQVVGSLPSPRLVNFLNLSITYQKGITSFGRPALFMLFPPEMYWRINCKELAISARYSKYILFSIYFDVELLNEIDAKSFLPWRRENESKTSFLRPHNINLNIYYLVKVTPKRDLLDKIPAKLLKPLWFFTSQGVLASTTKVIPFLEKWIPGCGPIFIAKGLTILTEFCDLDSSQILDVFFAFAEHPEYDNCSFHAAMDLHAYNTASHKISNDLMAETQDDEPKST